MFFSPLFFLEVRNRKNIYKGIKQVMVIKVVMQKDMLYFLWKESYMLQ